MIAAGADTPDGELKRRLDYMVSELGRCQQAAGDGYIGGVPGSRELWPAIATGRGKSSIGNGCRGITCTKLTRDCAIRTGSPATRRRAKSWCAMGTGARNLLPGLSDEQMQRMLGQEHGGMNEVLADIYAITGDEKYLHLAQRFNHKVVLDPLMRREDRLTGLHANTQIPKVIGLARIATLTGDQAAERRAHYFWENVTGKRGVVAFGGNSVSEHFNDPKDFRGMLEHREGPETCNTYNMLQLTKQLFVWNRRPLTPITTSAPSTITSSPPSTSSDRAYVYFTPIRPQHYRVYSQPGQGFWCCVGTGIENPGRYGEFIYAQATNGLYVNLFIASEITVTNLGLTLRQETAFPDEARTKLTC
jgi:uncharacterized protein